MGDRQRQVLRVQFDGRLRLESHGAKSTTDAGLLAFRELDEAFRLTEIRTRARAGAARKKSGFIVLEAERAGLSSRRAGRAARQARITAREVVFACIG